MENATNGLIMAGSVLIGVIVLSLFIYLFTSMGTIAKDFQENIDQAAIQKYNEPFEKYIGREDLSTHEVLTIYNLVQERNEDAGYDAIKLEGIGKINDEGKFLTSEKIYKWEIKDDIYSKETQKIEKIVLKQVINDF